MKKIRRYSKAVITAKALLKRWPGLTEDELVTHLEQANRNVNEEKSEFLRPAWLVRTTRSPETDGYLTEHIAWESDYDRAKDVFRRYLAGGLNSRKALNDLFEEVIFRRIDVEEYEKEHPEVKRQHIDPDIAWGNIVSSRPPKARAPLTTDSEASSAAGKKAKWQDYVDGLSNTKKDLRLKRAALAAIAKWDGDSHLVAHDKVFLKDMGRDENARTKAVSSLKATAEKIAESEKLDMPDWDTR